MRFWCFLLPYSSKLRNHNLQLFRIIVIRDIRNGNEREDLVTWATNQGFSSWLELRSHFGPSGARDTTEKVPDCLGHPPKNCLNAAGNCFVLSPFSFLISFTESPLKAWRGAKRLAAEGRILVLILKFHLEVGMRSQHLLEERKVAGADVVDGQEVSCQDLKLPRSIFTKCSYFPCPPCQR